MNHSSSADFLALTDLKDELSSYFSVLQVLNEDFEMNCKVQHNFAFALIQAIAECHVLLPKGNFCC